MSFLRAKLRATDRNVYYDNRLTNFTNRHVYYGNLYVEKDQFIGGNLEVSGNLTVRQDVNARSFYASGNYYLHNFILIPAGTVIQTAATIIPGGWLACDGSLLNRWGDYADLFSYIGYQYGGADNSFNIPDLRGRTIVGAGTGYGLSARSLGQLGGEEKHTLTISEMPSHTHTISNVPYGVQNFTAVSGSTTACDETTTTYTSNATGGSDPSHNNMQPYFVLQYLIKY